jgi:hypothetical protein
MASDLTRLEADIMCHGTLSWPALARTHKSLQKSWSRKLCELPPQHGIQEFDDDAVGVIFHPEIAALGKKYWNWIDNGVEGGSDALHRAQEIWNASAAEIGHFGDGINSGVFWTLSLGQVLVSFDPKIPGIENVVRREVEKIVARHREHHVGRSRCEDWLNVIREFEETQLNSKKNVILDDQLFARYRRIIGKWIWPRADDNLRA